MKPIDRPESGYLPTLDLSYTWSKTEMGSFDGNERTTLLSLSVPLFSGFSTVSTRAQTLANQLRQVHLYRDKIRADQADQKVVFKEFQIALRSSKARDKNVQLSRKLYKANYQRFQTGKSSVNDLWLT